MSKIIQVNFKSLISLVAHLVHRIDNYLNAMPLDDSKTYLTFAEAAAVYHRSERLFETFHKDCLLRTTYVGKSPLLHAGDLAYDVRHHLLDTRGNPNRCNCDKK